MTSQRELWLGAAQGQTRETVSSLLAAPASASGPVTSTCLGRGNCSRSLAPKRSTGPLTHRLGRVARRCLWSTQGHAAGLTATGPAFLGLRPSAGFLTNALAPFPPPLRGALHISITVLLCYRFAPTVFSLRWYIPPIFRMHYQACVLLYRPPAGPASSLRDSNPLWSRRDSLTSLAGRPSGWAASTLHRSAPATGRPSGMGSRLFARSYWGDLC